MSARVTLSALFDDEFTAQPLSLRDERVALTAARNGDAAAVDALLLTYIPAIRAAVSAAMRAIAPPSRAYVDTLHETRSRALLGVMEAIHESTGDRLAGVIKAKLREAIFGVDDSSSVLSVPARTRTRFFAIMRAAGGDVAEAARLAPTDNMTPETFYAVLDAMRSTSSLEDLVSEAGAADDAFVTIENRMLADMAFRAVDDAEATVCRLAYGFADYEPKPDAEIADWLAFSRSKVQRMRDGALAKMRRALDA